MSTESRQTEDPQLEPLVRMAIAHSQERYPEGLDLIFDNHPDTTNHQILLQISQSLSNDIDTLAWLCSYLASEINCIEDNQKSHQPIKELAHLLITAGMKPFKDFTPYVDGHILIGNIEKFHSLPEEIQQKAYQLFELHEISGDSIQQVNDVLLQKVKVS